MRRFAFVACALACVIARGAASDVVFDPPSGARGLGGALRVRVTLEDGDDDARVMYTLNGSEPNDPDASGHTRIYASPIVLPCVLMTRM